MNPRKSITSAIIGATLLGGAYVVPATVNEVQLSQVPQELRLKAPPSRVLADRVYEQFEFDTKTGERIPESRKEVVEYAYNSGVEVAPVDNEVEEMRTVSTYTQLIGTTTDARGRVVNKYVQTGTLGQRFVGEGDKWYYVGYATTTPEVFNMEVNRIAYAPLMIYAADTGFPNPGTVTATDSGCGTITWGLSGTVEDVKTSNDTRFISNVLDFGGPAQTDEIAQIVQSGSRVGDDKATGANDYGPTSNSDITVNYGGSSDLWGLTISDSDVNDSGFGWAYAQKRTSVSYCLHATNFGFSVSGTIDGLEAQVEAGENGTARSAIVDHMTLKVYYTGAAAARRIILPQ